MSRQTTLALILTALSLTACGSRGGLYLPQQPPKPPTTTSSPAATAPVTTSGSDLNTSK